MTYKNSGTQRFKPLTDKISEYIENKMLAGIVTMISHNNEIVHAEAYGYKNYENQTSQSLDDIFNIYSLMKPLYVVGALILYDRGKFNLEDPIYPYYPKAKEAKVFVEEKNGNLILEEIRREITFFDLMTNRSGLSVGFNNNHPADKLHNEIFNKIIREKLTRSKSMKEIVDLYFQ